MADLQSWIKTRLSGFAATQPDWEQQTVDELTSYLILLVESTKDEAALRTECQDFLQDFLGPATNGFIDEFCARIGGDSAQSQTATSTTSQESRPASRHDQFREARKQDATKRKRDDRSRSPHHRRSDSDRHQSAASGLANAGQSTSPLDPRRVSSLTASNQNPGRAASRIPTAPASSKSAVPTSPSLSQAYASGRNAQNNATGPAQQTNDDVSGINDMSLDQMPAFFPPAMPFAGGFGALIPMPCPNYTMFGFCLTADCAFIHDGSMQMPLFAPQTMSAPQVTQTNRTTLTKGDLRHNRSIMVLNIPSENLNEADVRGHFSKFGKITSVTFPDQGIAVIHFSSNEAAYRAKVSPEPIFNNRFVTTRWYKGVLPEVRSQNGGKAYNDHGDAADWQSPVSEQGLRRLAEARNQATQQRSYLTDLELRKTSIEQEIMEHDTNLRKLKRQIKDKTRTSPTGTDDDMESDSGDDELEKAALIRKKLVLQAELASIEATQKRQQAQQEFGAGSFMQLQPVHRIDNRPRRFCITIDTNNDEDDSRQQETAQSLQRMLMSHPIPPESVVADGEIFASTAEIEPEHEVIELGFEHHWQARRLLEQIADRFEDRIAVSWLNDNTSNTTGATGKSRVISSDYPPEDIGGGSRETHSRKKTGPVEEIDEERIANLDVAEEEDWMYD